MTPTKKSAVLYLDGEYNQVKVVMEGGAGQFAKEASIILFKLPASCSKTIQPNDVMKSYMILHKFFRSEQFRTFNLATAARPPYMPDVMQILGPIPKSSRDTFERYFLSLPYSFDTAFSTSTVSSGYTKTGVGWPPSVSRILQNFPSIENNFSDAEKDIIVERTYEVAQQGMELTMEGKGGTVSDITMEDKLAEFFGPVHNNSGRSTTDQVLNQWKATILTDENTIQQQRLVADEKEVAAQRSKEKRIAAQLAKDQKSAGARQKCDGKVVLMCLKDEIKKEVGTNRCDWWVCPVAKCNVAFCGSCSLNLQDLHLKSHQTKT